MKNKIITVALCLASVPLLSMRRHRQPSPELVQRGLASKCTMLKDKITNIRKDIQSKGEELNRTSWNPFKRNRLQEEIQNLQEELHLYNNHLIRSCTPKYERQ